MFLLKENYWEVKETKSKGRGIFAKNPISEGTLIGDYVGKLVHLKDVDFDKEKENLYLMYYSDTTGIYPNLKKPGIYLLNHSCTPNCWIFKFNRHTLVFALKNIKKGDELTISYLFPPCKQCIDCTHICSCESKVCTGSMHLTEGGYKKWQDFQDKEERKEKRNIIKNENTLKLLTKYPKSISKSYIAKIKKLEIR
ncbi:hypothetical protein A2865_00505 [Candidatus Woesebacteria bacterium RIFCSPHIGHO2_01_FULL_39_17]|uniref:Nuclear protein SET n=2 Tax=Candidatus Woeseibacteriota TaxID=1752722 RepID=A0A0G0ND89_9BACT|nr:MAG: Nuclear protein SET [Microgenomates group bacterium GW2011_GWC1_38_12]KKR14084.1 MAG: Nuclear protein SET [Candidatus Woesebacteria bacterium GW2011_GWA1_39_21b]OGM23668.1 MAG: hypothetical protein A2865_00505 [Candidatus Woesebacteria bacterium RIFCSPHIGHO2_01_FULL_39_17]OGM64699.1 MAG: hypothetical protein A3A52_04325 [Candidatus Woesebacteria bacterium RIFCSPLOWO2_01_FULL_39_14]